MKVFRFMSKEEFELLKSGKTLINKKDHKLTNKCISVGFCFFDYEDCNPAYAYEFLSGIVSDDVCVEFEVDKSFLKGSGGTYADPYGDNFFSTIWMTEYCCTSYNNKDFKILAYAENYDDYKHKWIEYQETA